MEKLRQMQPASRNHAKAPMQPPPPSPDSDCDTPPVYDCDTWQEYREPDSQHMPVDGVSDIAFSDGDIVENIPQVLHNPKWNSAMLRFFKRGHRKEPSTKIPSLHYNWIFFASLDGGVQFVTKRGQRPAAQEHRLWIVSPQKSHCFVCGPETERIVLAFPSVSPLLQKMCASEGFLSCNLTEADVHFLRTFGEEIDRHFHSPNPKSLLIFEKALNELSLLLLRDHNFDSFSPLSLQRSGRIERAINFYLDNLSDRPKIDVIAQHAGVSVAHLRRLFHEVFNQSPTTILIKLSLEKAIQQMMTTTDTLDAIAEAFGFKSSSNFTRVFHKHYGCPPSTWRNYVSPLAKTRGKNERKLLEMEITLGTGHDLKPAPAQGS